MKTIIPVVKCESVKLTNPTLNVERVLEACGYKLMDARLQADSYVMSNNMLTIFTQDTHHNIMCDDFVTEERGRLELSRIREADKLMKLCMLISNLLNIDRDRLARAVAESLVAMPKSTCSINFIKDEIKDLVTKYVTDGLSEAEQYVKNSHHFIYDESYYTIKDSDIESLVEDVTCSILYVLRAVYEARAKEILPFRAPSRGGNPTLFRVLSVIRLDVEEMVEEAKAAAQPQPTTTKKKKWYQIF